MSALMAIKDSGGFAVSVSDDEILKSIPELARSTGVFAEPAGAAGLAGLKKAIKEGKVDDGDSVVLIATGNGLKDIKSAVKATGKPFCINPDINELKSLVDSGKI